MKVHITRRAIFVAIHQPHGAGTFELICEALARVIRREKRSSSVDIYIFPDFGSAKGESTAIKDVIHDFLKQVPRQYEKGRAATPEEKVSRVCAIISLLYKAISVRNAGDLDYYFHDSNTSTQTTSPLMDAVLQNQYALAKVLVEECKCTFNPRDRVEHADMLEKVAGMHDGWRVLELIAPLAVYNKHIDNPYVFYDEGVPWDERRNAMHAAIRQLSAKTVSVLIDAYGADVNSAEQVEAYQALVRSVLETEYMPAELYDDEWRRASIIYNNLEQRWKAIVVATGVFETEIMDRRLSKTLMDDSRRAQLPWLAQIPPHIHQTYIAPRLIRPTPHD